MFLKTGAVKKTSNSELIHGLEANTAPSGTVNPGLDGSEARLLACLPWQWNGGQPETPSPARSRANRPVV
nr:unnamed protein product [Spirometra erinaceieuropaei]